MGEVYRARDTRLQRDVAVKVLPDLQSADPDRLARLQREAQALASLNASIDRIDVSCTGATNCRGAARRAESPHPRPIRRSA
jgi:serine/threonine protein kinase